MFNNTLVESFTLPFSDELQDHKEKALRQVRVQYPPEEGAFIVELFTTDHDHHLMLAKVEAESTLAETVKKSLGYIDSLERKGLRTKQALKVPLFNFDITKNLESQREQRLHNHKIRRCFVPDPKLQEQLLRYPGK